MKTPGILILFEWIIMIEANKFEIEMSKHEPYRIRAINKNIDFISCKPALDCFIVYDEDKGDDVQIFPQDVSGIEYQVISEDDDIYAIIISGVVTVSSEDKELILSKGGAVDYAIDFNTKDDESIESDQDYEFVENYNILLTQVKS